MQRSGTRSFFYFSALLSNPVFEDRYQVIIANSDKEKIPSLCLESVSKAKKHLSIESWLSAFMFLLECTLVGVPMRPPPS